jgi:hypothetical protein
MTSNKASGDHARGIRVGRDRVQEANYFLCGDEGDGDGL